MGIKAKMDDASGAGISLAFPGRTADKAAAVPESPPPPPPRVKRARVKKLWGLAPKKQAVPCYARTAV